MATVVLGRAQFTSLALADTIRSVIPRKPAVIVVNYNSAEMIRRNIAPLVRELPGLTTVVVDNYSTDLARRQIEELSSSQDWDLVTSDVNGGFGAGMNLGIARATTLGADTFLLLNPDASLSREDFEALTARISEDPMSIISPLIKRPDGSIWFRGGALDVDRGRTLSRPAHGGSEREWPWLTGACMMASAEVWEVLGGFDEDYFLYWEDVDLSVRAQRAGVRLEVVESATAVHDEGGTQEQSSNSDFSWDYYYFNIRNRLLFASKLLDGSDRRRWYRSSLRESYLILLRGGGKRKFLRSFAPLSCGARGIRDGIRGGRLARQGQPVRFPLSASGD